MNTDQQKVEGIDAATGVQRAVSYLKRRHPLTERTFWRTFTESLVRQMEVIADQVDIEEQRHKAYQEFFKSLK